MKISFGKLAPAMGALVLAMMTLPMAQAQCGGLPGKLAKPSSWSPKYSAPRIMKVSLGNGDEQDGGPSIMGMWHVVFTGQTQDGGPYTLPEPFDDSLIVWHGDGTEIMNSSRPVQDGNFCMGVWKQTGERKYYVNHLPWHANTPDNAPGGIGYPIDGAQTHRTNHLKSGRKSLFGDLQGGVVRFERKSGRDVFRRADSHTHHDEHTIQ